MAANSPWADIDPREALRSLGYTDATDPQPVTGGWDTGLWRFATDDGSQHALRIFRGPERADGARRERVALEAAALP